MKSPRRAILGAGLAGVVLAAGLAAGMLPSSNAASASVSGRAIFCADFVPLERESWQPGKVLAKWASQNPGERSRWSAYADEICAGVASPASPSVSTLHGRALVAVGRTALAEDNPPPPTTTTTTDTTTTMTTTTTEPPPPSSWPSSYTNGPAGTGNILPSRQGALLGTAPWGARGYDGIATHYQQFEAFLGRKLDIEHRFIQGTCTIHDPARPNLLNEIVARGHIPMISWFPNPANGGQILRGDADDCIRQVGQQLSALPFKIFLRACWEFNGVPAWYACGNDTDGSKLTATEQRDTHRRIVDRLRDGGAFPNTSFLWCPHEGYFGNGDSFDEMDAYPGDEYVDWVCSDEYNWAPNWCGFHYGWCELSQLLTHGGKSAGVEQVFRDRKPYMLGETGVGEQGGDKGQWFRNGRDYAKTTATSLHALVYFDLVDGTTDWRIETSENSKQGFRDLALDPHFNAR